MEPIIIPVEFKATHNKKVGIIPSEIEELAFADITVKTEDSDLRITEVDIEEFVRLHISLIFPDETLQIVGQQVINKEGGRSDLVAIDREGNIVLIELKRDQKDIIFRKEAFEFQAIRYAANYALIKESEKLVDKLFAPYVEKHREEFGKKELTEFQLAQEKLEDFLARNKIDEQDFNQKQRIVLIASSFDDQTLSACAWLSKNSVDLCCITISPIKYNQQYFLKIEQLIPPKPIDEYFVEVAERTIGKRKSAIAESKIARENLPRMPKLFEWGIIKPNDTVYVSTNPSEKAQVVDAQNVKYKGRNMTFNEWGQHITGWSAINIYEWTYLESSGKSLQELRKAKLEELETESSKST